MSYLRSNGGVAAGSDLESSLILVLQLGGLGYACCKYTFTVAGPDYY